MCGLLIHANVRCDSVRCALLVVVLLLLLLLLLRKDSQVEARGRGRELGEGWGDRRG